MSHIVTPASVQECVDAVNKIPLKEDHSTTFHPNYFYVVVLLDYYYKKGHMDTLVDQCELKLNCLTLPYIRRACIDVMRLLNK
jgi:hypothetical protein